MTCTPSEFHIDRLHPSAQSILIFVPDTSLRDTNNTTMIVIEPSWPDLPGKPKASHVLRGGQHGIVDMYDAAFGEFSRVPGAQWREFRPHEELLVSQVVC